MAKMNFQTIKNSASAVAPIATLAYSFTAPKSVQKNVSRAQNAMGAIRQVEAGVNNTIDSAKNATKNNPYHGKLNNPYQEKFASEEEGRDEKKKKKIKTLAKVAPYATGAALLLAYGTQAAKDKSLVLPIKKSVSGVPGATMGQIKKKSDAVKGLVNGAKKGLKEKNNITVIQQKKTPLDSFINGAAWGAGTLGAHMLGSAFFKNKQADVAKSYKKSQPALVKTVETAKEIKEIMDKHKNQSGETQEKTAGIKGAKWLSKMGEKGSELFSKVDEKALDNNINLHKVWEDAVKYPAATAVAAWGAKELVNKGNRLIRERAKKDYLKHLEKKKAKSEKAQNDNEKTASEKAIIGEKAKQSIKNYIRKYGEGNLKSALKPISGAAVAIPLVYGSEILKQRKITKKINERNAEREKQEQERNNNGRDYKGGKRDRNFEHNV